MNEITLYHYWRSSSSWRVRWSLELKKIPHKLVAIDLLKAEHQSPNYLQKNPAGQVPCLQVDNKFFNESLPILEWLEELYPQPALLPSLPDERLEVRALALTIVAGTQPMQNLAAQRYYSDDIERRKIYSQHWIKRGLSAYESMLKLNQSSGLYSFGNQISLADLCLIPQCYNAERFEVDLNNFPLMQAINQRCLATQACKASSPASYTP